jgi:hypothetical protein
MPRPRIDVGVAGGCDVIETIALGPVLGFALGRRRLQ